MADKTPLNNNPSMRSFSDRVDKVMGWAGYDDPKQSSVRAAMHGVYHQIQYNRTGNQREMERAKDQYCFAKGGTNETCTNLKTYDEKKFGK